MKKILMLAVVGLICLTSISDAGLFSRRSSGSCANGSCPTSSVVYTTQAEFVVTDNSEKIKVLLAQMTELAQQIAELRQTPVATPPQVAPMPVPIQAPKIVIKDVAPMVAVEVTQSAACGSSGLLAARYDASGNRIFRTPVRTVVHNILSGKGILGRR